MSLQDLSRDWQIGYAPETRQDLGSSQIGYAPDRTPPAGTTGLLRLITGSPTFQEQPPQLLQPQPQPERAPEQAPPSEPVPTPTPRPPEADKAPPPQERYIPSRRDAPHWTWAKPDLVEQGMVNYPALLPAPYGPQPHEWQGIMQNSHRFLGSIGSGIIAPLAQGLLLFAPGYQQARAAGNEYRQRMYAANFALYAKQLAFQQAQESRDYGEVFAALGPTDANGKPNPRYDENRFRQALMEVAAKHHDTQKIQAAWDGGGAAAVERMIASRDASGKDHTKVMTQMLRAQQLRNAQLIEQERLLRIEAAKRKAGEQWHQDDMLRGDTNQSVPAPKEMGLPPGYPAPPPGSEQGDPGLFSVDTTEKPEKEAPAEPEIPEDRIQDDERSEADQPDTTAQEAQAEPETEAAPKTQEPAQRAAAAPTEAPAAAAPAAAAPTPTPTQAAAARQPTRLAQADTGVATDAPSPAETVRPKGEQPTAAPSEAARPATREPARVGPAPEAQPHVPAPFAGTEQPRPEEPQEPTAGDRWQPTESQVHQLMLGHVDPVSGRPDPYRNLSFIDEMAQHKVNGTLTMKDWNALSKAARPLVLSRAVEIDRDMIRIRKSNLAGEDVYKALEKTNAEFAGRLKSYVDGTTPVPLSAWKDPNFVRHVAELGVKVDPSFNQANFSIRGRTKQAAASGVIARQVISNTTLHVHSGRALETLDELDKLDPNWAQYAAGGSRIGEALGQIPMIGGRLAPTPRMQELMQKFETERETIATEAARAKSGAAPHAGAMDRELKLIDIRTQTPRAVRAALVNNQTLSEDRTRTIVQNYNAVMGPRISRIDPLSKLLNGYASGVYPRGTETPGWLPDQEFGKPGGDELGAYASPNAPGIMERAQQMITGASGPRAPGAPLVAPRPSLSLPETMPSYRKTAD